LESEGTNYPKSTILFVKNAISVLKFNQSEADKGFL